MIYVFGNSHAHSFTNSIVSKKEFGNNKNEYFTSYSLEPTIAYNFYEHHYLHLLNIINNLNITKNDYILLAVGEVDCRWHLPKQASVQNRNINDVVIECVNRFFRCLIDLKNKGYNIIGWGGHSSTTGKHNDDLSNFVYGNCFTKNKISLLYSDTLKELCHNNDIKFISIISNLID